MARTAVLAIALALASGVAVADDATEDGQRFHIVNYEDPLPKPPRMSELIDTRGMSQRNFRKALKSWKGKELSWFRGYWRGVLDESLADGDSAVRVFRIEDQDWQRLERSLVRFPCDPMSCIGGFKVPVLISDNDVRRIRSCEIRLLMDGEIIDRIELDNDGCRFNAEERERHRFDPETFPFGPAYTSRGPGTAR